MSDADVSRGGSVAVLELFDNAFAGFIVGGGCGDEVSEAAAHGLIGGGVCGADVRVLVFIKPGRKDWAESQCLTRQQASRGDTPH